MRLNFRQGIHSMPSNFFVPTVTGIDISTANGSLELAIADADNNYFHVESNDVLGAWTAASSPVMVWLFIELDSVSGVRTFGTANQDQIVSATVPTTPVDGQHWFDTSTNKMKRYIATSSSFIEVMRIFVGTYVNGVTAAYSANGVSQIGVSAGDVIYRTGRILYDSFGKSIRIDDGSFLTAESDFYTYGNVAHSTRLETNIIFARASENIPANSVVIYDDYDGVTYGKCSLADYPDTDNGVIGYSTTTILSGEVGTVILQGEIVNGAWDWPGDSIPNGSELWIGTGLNIGTLVASDPADGNPSLDRRSPVARVIKSNGVLFMQSFGLAGLPGPPGPTGAGTAPATTTTLGSGILSTTPGDANNPVIVEDSDPRLSDSRPPTAHTHAAVDVSTTAFGPYGISTVQAILEFLDTDKLNLSGGTLTGLLTLSTGPTLDLHAASKKYVDDTIALLAVLKAGDTMTGFLVLDDDPVLDLHAATKRYVDNATAAAVQQGGVYITDMEAQDTVNDNVGDKVVTAGELVSATSSTTEIVVYVSAVSSPDSLVPVVDVEGNTVTNFVLNNGLWEGSVNVTVAGSGPVTATHSAGDTSSTTLTIAAGPVISAAVFDGAGVVYVGTGATTSLRAGVTVNLAVTSDLVLDDIEILTSVAVNDDAAVVEVINVTGTGVGVGPYVYTISVTIEDNGTSATNRSIRLRARDTIGSWGVAVDTTDFGAVEEINFVKCDNLLPTLTITGIVYPASQAAIKTGESATVGVTTANLDSVSYSSPGAELTITNPLLDEANKTVTYLAGTYNVLTDNFSGTATRAANGGTATDTTVVFIANADPVVDILHPALRLRSGGNQGTVAQDHTITIDADQQLISAPTVVASVGTFQGGAFVDTGSGEEWERDLQINDNDTKGAATFGTLVVTNLAGKVVNVINSGASYTVGGFVTRDLTFAAFQEISAIGTLVTDTAKLVAEDFDAQAMTYQADKTDGVRVYTIALSTGSPVYTEDPNGDTVWWADLTGVNNNTTGLAFIRIEETV